MSGKEELQRLWETRPDKVDFSGVMPLDKSKAKSAAAIHETALHVDDWTRVQAKEILSSDRPIIDLALCVAPKDALQETAAVADFHASLFDAELVYNERLWAGAAFRRAFIERLEASPDFQALRATTILDATATRLALASIYKRYVEGLVSGRAEKFLYAETAERDAADEDDTEDDDYDYDAEEEDYDKDVAESVAADVATLRSIHEGVAEAASVVEEAMETERALSAGGGLGAGGGGRGVIDYRRLAELHKKVRNDPQVRRILEYTGKLRPLMQSCQRRKVTHGADEVLGVTLGSRLDRLLKSELALLGEPLLEDYQLSRILSKQALCRQLASLEPVGKGPIICSVDTSGSMSGAKVETAKAVALTIAWMARMQRRWCGLIDYSGDTGSLLLPLRPGTCDYEQVLAWCANFFSLGSTLDVPIRELPQYYLELGAPKGKTDVILITDAICVVPASAAASFKAWKKQVQARVISVIIGAEPGDLADLSDEVWQIPELTAGEPAVERLFSI